MKNALNKKGGKKLTKKQTRYRQLAFYLFTGIIVSIIFTLFYDAIFALCVRAIDHLLVILDDENIQPGTSNELEEMDLKKPPPLIKGIVSISKGKIKGVNWQPGGKFLRSIIAFHEPIVIKNMDPLQDWSIFKNDFDLLTFAKSHSIMLENVRYQPDPLFIVGHDRDRGGMLGSRKDRPLLYTNMTLEKYLELIVKNNTYLYWTGQLHMWENFTTTHEPLTGDGNDSSNKGWQYFRVIEKELESLVDEDDVSIWKQMLWLSHPGVITQTHYDTQQNFLIHIQGRKRILLFPPNSELYQYPNIHRSYRQSQIMLECKNLENCNSEESRQNILKQFPLLNNVNNDNQTTGTVAMEVDLSPGDILYIPPYWSHRVEAHSLCLSLSIVSPSLVETLVAEAYWHPVPFGSFQNTTVHRVTAVTHYLDLVINSFNNITTGGNKLVDISPEIYTFHDLEIFIPLCGSMPDILVRPTYALSMTSLLVCSIYPEINSNWHLKMWRLY